MGKRRLPKRNSSIYDDPSENIRVNENNRLFDSFTREDVAVHRQINQFTIEADPNSELPESKRQVLERFVSMPRKIITRSMLTFINSSSDSGTTSKSLNIRPIPTQSSLIHSKEQEEIDPRSRGEAMQVKSNASIQGYSSNTFFKDRREAPSSPVPPPFQDPEPVSIDRRSFGEAFMVQRNAGIISKPDTWNMSSITQVLSGFEMSSSISTRVKSSQTFGRSTFTMTGNPNLSRLNRSKIPELPQVASKKPSLFRTATESPPTFRPLVTESPPTFRASVTESPLTFRASVTESPPTFCPLATESPPTFCPSVTEPPPTFRPPTTETVPPSQQSVQPSPPKPPSDPVDPTDCVTSPSTGLPLEQGSFESTYTGMFWDLINRGWMYLRDSFNLIWESLSK